MNIGKLVGAAAVLISVASLTLSAQAGDIKLAIQPDLTWETTPEGVAFAALKGNRFSESYMAMVRLPAGLVSPVHTKSSAMFGLIVSGEMVHQSEDGVGGKEVVLKPGDYYEIPAHLPHLSKCVSEAECVTFLYQDGPFDFVPVGEGQK
ncbi:cupin domain-containing protein [uncultured Roseibium sp.]|uniref:cupin domain-containing protein n=1 Tax=uncultured Roseibium sp. TaxID=1936171 RepID=UPI00262EB43C|nr:cupin domain-containing protein [uncultured Roseibium sp.]